MAQFGAGQREALPEVLEALSPSSVFCVVDAAVADPFGFPAGVDERESAVLHGGEHSKDIAHWCGLLDRLVQAHLDRDAVIVAVGGGCVLDLAGFAAASYLRGVRWVALPTTLLAQVDAAHGGKTGIDHPAAKNLLGAFHEPEEVLVDTDYLASLPERELRGGLAEVVKHGVLANPELLERVGREDPAGFVEEAAQVKLDIVARDPREKGERRLLNLGHTLGHAIERGSDYALHHGEAISLGLRAACMIAEGHCGFRERAKVEQTLERCGLPRSAGRIEREAVAKALLHDKKRRAGHLRWVLPLEIGRAEVFEDVSEAEINSALTAVTEAS